MTGFQALREAGNATHNAAHNGHGEAFTSSVSRWKWPSQAHYVNNMDLHNREEMAEYTASSRASDDCASFTDYPLSEPRYTVVLTECMSWTGGPPLTPLYPIVSDKPLLDSDTKNALYDAYEMAEAFDHPYPYPHPNDSTHENALIDQPASHYVEMHNEYADVHNACSEPCWNAMPDGLSPSVVTPAGGTVESAPPCVSRLDDEQETSLLWW